MESTLSSFAAVLRDARLARGLSQEELAERAALSVQGVSALERGIRRRPYPATVVRLADALALAGEDRDEFEEAARGASRRGERRPALRPPFDRDAVLREMMQYALAVAFATVRA